jgi:hypothetical protein
MAVATKKRLSAFDLDDLRDAFKKSVREHDVTPSDWAEFAKQFLSDITNRRLGKDAAHSA